MTILLVEDNYSIIKGLVYALNEQNYNVIYKTNIKDTILFLDNNIVDLIILDIMLPDGDGFYLYKNIIKNKNIPTIFLTAQYDEETIVNSLNIGAEDYIVKPFRTKELIARINKILLRNKQSNIIRVGNISFNIDKMLVYKNNDLIALTPLELKILYLLFTNVNKVVTRNMILDEIWNSTGNDVDDHTITVYLKRIREKLKTDLITTIKGIGYRIDNEK